MRPLVCRIGHLNEQFATGTSSGKSSNLFVGNEEQI